MTSTCFEKKSSDESFTKIIYRPCPSGTDVDTGETVYPNAGAQLKVWDVDGVTHADPESIFSGSGALNVPSEHPSGNANISAINEKWIIDLKASGDLPNAGGLANGLTIPINSFETYTGTGDNITGAGQGFLSTGDYIWSPNTPTRLNAAYVPATNVGDVTITDTMTDSTAPTDMVTARYAPDTATDDTLDLSVDVQRPQNQAFMANTRARYNEGQQILNYTTADGTVLDSVDVVASSLYQVRILNRSDRSLINLFTVSMARVDTGRGGNDNIQFVGDEAFFLTAFDFTPENMLEMYNLTPDDYIIRFHTISGNTNVTYDSFATSSAGGSGSGEGEEDNSVEVEAGETQALQEGWVYIPNDNTTLEFAVTGSPEVDVWLADEGGVPSHVYSSDGDLEDTSVEFATVDKGWHFLNVRLSDEDGTSSWELLTDVGGTSPSTPFEGLTSATAPEYCCEEVESDYELQEGEIDCAAKLPHPNQSLPESPNSVTARLVEYKGGVDNNGSQSFAENMTITQLSNTGRWRIDLDPPHPDGVDYSPSVILEEQAATRRAMVFEIEQDSVTADGFLLTVTNANSATRVVTPWRMAIHGGERKILVGD